MKEILLYICLPIFCLLLLTIWVYMLTTRRSAFSVTIQGLGLKIMIKTSGSEPKSCLHLPTSKEFQ